MRFGELLGVLLLGQLGRLLLESHLLDPAPRRLELLIGGEPQLVGAAQLGGDRLEPVARRSQRLLGAAARDRAAPAAIARPASSRSARRSVASCASSASCCATCAAIASRRRVELGDALAARALGESGFLRRPLRRARALASSRQRDLGLVARMPRALARGAFARRGGVRVRGDFGIDRRHRIALGALLDRQRSELLGDLRAPALRRFRRLLQLQQLQLEIVAAALLRRQRHAFAVVFLLPRLELALGASRALAAAAVAARAAPIAWASSASSRWRASTPCRSLSGAKKPIDCALTTWPAGVTKASPTASDAAIAQRGREVVAAAHAGEPVAEHAVELGSGCLDLGEQRIAARGSARAAARPAHTPRCGPAARRRRRSIRRRHPAPAVRAH